LRIMQEKSERISKRVQAMKTYEQYLEQVKEKNPDEYVELSDILKRYNTLKTSNMKLNENLR